jgi:hypothetical protein
VTSYSVPWQDQSPNIILQIEKKKKKKTNLPRQSNLFEKLGRGTNNKQRGGKSNQREKGTI